MLHQLLFFTVALCRDQYIFNYGDKSNKIDQIGGFETALRVWPQAADDLAKLTSGDAELLRRAWDEALIRNPKQVHTALQPSNSPSRSRPPPLRTSKKSGFTVHKHPDFPNYELRIKDPGPELQIDSVQQYSGYIDVINEDKHFFFWIFESRNRPQTDPLVLWLNGGPGCSSSTGQFFEMGPSMINENMSMSSNLYSWNEAATLIFLDQPVNVGYSYSSQRVSDSNAAGEDVYAFLEILFKALPQYASLDFHISGESYAGKYIPKIGSAILNHPERSFNLTSAMIGNPLSDLEQQMFSNVAMSCGDGGLPSLLSDSQCADLYRKVPECERLLYMCYDSNQDYLICTGASLYCSQFQQALVSTGKNPYDIRMSCGNDCYPEIKAIEQYLRQPEVIKAVGSDVDDFVGCSTDVAVDFSNTNDFTLSAVPDIVRMLDSGIDVLFYDGEADGVCGWPGVYELVSRLRFKHHAEFTAQSPQLWEVDGKPLGETKTAGNLTWLKVYGAGHMVPHDVPEAALLMLRQWLGGRRPLYM